MELQSRSDPLRESLRNIQYSPDIYRIARGYNMDNHFRKRKIAQTVIGLRMVSTIERPDGWFETIVVLKSDYDALTRTYRDYDWSNLKYLDVFATEKEARVAHSKICAQLDLQESKRRLKTRRRS